MRWSGSWHCSSSPVSTSQCRFPTSCRRKNSSPTKRRIVFSKTSGGRRSTLTPATSFRWSAHSDFLPRWMRHRSMCIVRCVRLIRRRTCFLLDFEGYSLVGASPEIHVRCEDRRVEIRPIAGTRPRGRATLEEDLALEKELLADPKERAEHVMLVDLARNDIGRVCDIRLGGGERPHDHRALQPCDAHRHAGGGQSHGGTHAVRPDPGDLPGGDALRRAEDSRDADHRRV